MKAPASFRKKPVIVDAILFDGKNVDAVQAFTGFATFGLVAPTDRTEDPDITAEVFDKLHSTWVGVKDGQWIIKGVQAEFYPCDASVFAATYEPTAKEN